MSFTTEHDEIIAEIPSYIRVYKNGVVERPRQTPFVPPSLHAGSSSKDVVISDDPSISARIFLPKSPDDSHKKKLPILVYFHGGGFFFESAFSHQHHHYFTIFLSHVNAVVVSVEYRLAPEHILPAAYDDCWDALKWVARCSTKFPNEEPWLNHGDFGKIFIGGDSAGGNIVHNIAMRARVEDLPCGVKILGAILGHPVFYGSRPIGSEPKEGREQSEAYMCWKFAYPGAPGGIDNPMVNPLGDGAPSLDGLECGKILVCVAGKDGLRDRGVWYYEGVKNSGWKGKLELFEVEEEDHVFHMYDPESENSKMMMKRIASFIMEK